MMECGVNLFPLQQKNIVIETALYCPIKWLKEYAVFDLLFFFFGHILMFGERVGSVDGRLSVTE